MENQQINWASLYLICTLSLSISLSIRRSGDMLVSHHCDPGLVLCIRMKDAPVVTSWYSAFPYSGTWTCIELACFSILVIQIKINFHRYSRYLLNDIGVLFGCVQIVWYMHSFMGVVLLNHLCKSKKYAYIRII